MLREFLKFLFGSDDKNKKSSYNRYYDNDEDSSAYDEYDEDHELDEDGYCEECDDYHNEQINDKMNNSHCLNDGGCCFLEAKVPAFVRKILFSS